MTGTGVMETAPARKGRLSGRTRKRRVGRAADGSRVNTWNLDIATGGAREIPVEVLVPRDGRYAISAELEGTVGGRAIRRGSAGTLFVGKREAPLPSREGAIEYLADEAAETGEVQP